MFAAGSGGVPGIDGSGWGQVSSDPPHALAFGGQKLREDSVAAASLASRVLAALREAGIAPGDRLVVAVSGGVDSMGLLDLLVQLGRRLPLKLHVAHVHHGLRGRAADREAALVIATAARHGLGVTLCHLDPRERPRGASLEMWARAGRYACLEAVSARVRAVAIATAHTRNDQAETVLLNLLRGTGPRGLAGIPPVRPRVVRPLLDVARPELEAYAAARRVPFRQDASNASPAFRRNRVRHRLLPQLAAEYNPRLAESLAALARQLREDEDVLSGQAAALAARLVSVRAGLLRLERARLRQVAPALSRRVFQAAVAQAGRGRVGLTRRHLAGLARLLTEAGTVRLPGGLEARVCGAELVIGPGAQAAGAPAPAGAVPLRLGAWASWPPLGCRLRVRQVAGPRPARSLRDRWRALLGPELLRAPLSLRGWRPGDRFRPLGLAGRKKLQDFFVDAKVPREERGRLPLLLSGDRIAWVVGHRVAEEFRWPGRGPACVVEVRFPVTRRRACATDSDPS
jgi:tRNA(Ile)-lysidine synthase